MRTNAIAVFLCLLAVSLFSFAAPLPDIESQTDQLLKSYVQHNEFSGNVLVAQNGQVTYQKSTGFANKKDQTRLNTNTRFNVGSIGKHFTAILVLQLAEADKLNLDDPIGNYIKGFEDPNAAKVTIRQVLQHQAGFGDYMHSAAFKENPRQFENLNSLLKLVKAEPLAFETGTRAYSNSGYVLLGGVIEAVTEQPYSVVLSQKILQIADMRNTLFDRIADADNRATGYTQLLRGSFEPITASEAAPSPAGGLYSTTNDLFKFAHTLTYTDQLLSEASKNLLENDFDTKNSAYNSGGISIIAGGAPGISATLLQDTEKGHTIIVLSNHGDGIAEQIAENAAAMLRGESYEDPQLPAYRYAYQQITDKKLNNMIENYAAIMQEGGYDAQDHSVLNEIGYKLLEEQYTMQAIRIFKANCALFPHEANTFDSLGEAYMTLGRKKKAKMYYEQSLALNPDNSHASRILTELK